MRNLNYRQIKEALEKLGCVELERKGKGSHRKWYNPKTGRATVIPDWGKKPLKTGTVNAILKQLGVDREEFMKFIRQ